MLEFLQRIPQMLGLKLPPSATRTAASGRQEPEAGVTKARRGRGTGRGTTPPAGKAQGGSRGRRKQ